MLGRMTRITVDVNDEWLEAAMEALGTTTKVATINEALRAFAVRRKAREIIAAFNSVEMDYSGSAQAWEHGGGRDLSRLEEDVREAVARDAA
jgi:Arc/MetJ family transcription regulator